MFMIGYCLVGIFCTVLTWVLVSKQLQKKFSHQWATSEEARIRAESILQEVRTQYDHYQQTAVAELMQSREALIRESDLKTQALTEKHLIQTQFQEEKKRLEELMIQMQHTFKSLASTSLQDNSTSFLTLAKESMFNPIQDNLKKFEIYIQNIEKMRQESHTSLDTQIKNLLGAQEKLQKETSNLVTALRAPQVRGRWGELTLRRVVELAGMSEHCDFSEQVSIQSDEGRMRPDLIIHMPSNREIVVDSKVALDAYLDALSANTDVDRMAALHRHATQIKTHMRQLSEKKYWDQFDQAPDFVVMFIPGESFFSAAVEMEPRLIEDGFEKKVLLATPTTLIALLRAISYGWKQEQLAQNAQKISQLGKQLHDRIGKFSEHLQKMGRGLEVATKAYNDSVGSFEHNVLPSARRFKELGAHSSRDLDEITLDGLDIQPRQLL